ncbi:hypothetical protein PT974_03912 [Cladobotryum mycophilum]|uniref:Uncharacterized protein n=1 Tax=Cladobotryum mycophilum TaxID=491253 RepID=A0ABR0STQ3_9HYPO
MDLSTRTNTLQPSSSSSQMTLPHYKQSPIAMQDDSCLAPRRSLFSGDRGLPRSKSVYDSSSAVQEHSRRINHCMISCPDLHPVGKDQWTDANISEALQDSCNRRGSHSQPITPPNFRERLAIRFRRRRPWESPQSLRSSTMGQFAAPRFQDGRERRRRARESREHHSPSDIAALRQNTQLGGEGVSPLVVAGIVMAAELDRLSQMARTRGDESEGS